MDQTLPVPPVPQFKDRRGGLIAFGILLIVGGCFCALFVPMTLLGPAMAARETGVAPDYRMVIPGALMYGVLAVAFVWLGIGSIKARRWARALTLILAWLWLVTGVISIGIMIVILPQALANPPPGGQALPEAARIMATIVAVAVTGVLFVLLPGVLVFFYGSRHVKATCEARDPVRRWTDACPLPVLALSLVLAYSVVMWIPTFLVLQRSVVPFFGRLLSGAPGTAVIVTLMALWGYSAWATYRLKPAGWWVVVTTLAVMTVSSLLTFSRVDVIEMYRLMEVSEEQIQQFEQYGFFQGRSMLLVVALSALPVFGYLLYVKKFFRRRIQT